MPVDFSVVTAFPADGGQVIAQARTENRGDIVTSKAAATVVA